MPEKDLTHHNTTPQRINDPSTVTDMVSEDGKVAPRITQGTALSIKHILYDGYEGDGEKMADMAHVHEVAVSLGNLLGIKSIDNPHTIPYFDGAVPEDSGVSAVWLFPGGHITIHTFDQKGTVFIDAALMDQKGPNGIEGIQTSMREAFGVKRDETFLRGENPAENKEEVPKAFGPHLTFNGRLQSQQMNLEWIYDFLETIPKNIGMTPISTPSVKRGVQEEGQRGIDGMIVIAESHIAIHAKPDGSFYFDIFSCKAFDTEGFTEVAKRKGLIIDESSIVLTIRGKDFPRNNEERRG